jgi:hypothetical protein
MPRPKQVKCPECMTDARAVGFCAEATVSRTYMPIGGEMQVIATVERAIEKVFCNGCGKRLIVDVDELTKA